MKLDWIGYYKLNESNVEDYVPTAAGVYKISVKRKSGYVKPVYVGQTINLYSRLRQYVNLDTKNDCLKENLSEYNCEFKVAKVGLQSDRDAAERALYDHYQPECNDPDAIPDVEPADINYD